MSSEVFARDHYEREDIARIYGQWKDLLAAEKVLLELYRERIQNQRVLDLGCGGGRTSPWLHALASRYLGVDYSARMVEVCRARYPEFAFTQGNARDLAALANARFDFVLFSYNCGFCLHAADHAWLAH
jgi:ubiquinone/menaquinone biosynthesis C-methylase UbiE